MEKFLKNLYQKFQKFEKDIYLKDASGWLGVGELKLNRKTLESFYDNYQKSSFIRFLEDVKNIIYYPKTPFEFILKTSVEDWNLWVYLEFLKKEKIIEIKKEGSISILKKEILNLIPRPRTEKEIKEKIERKLKIKVKESEPVINLFQKFHEFEVKAKWDQLPISQGSAILVAQKILERLPLNKKFLFVGDDDFISVILSLAEPKMESLVIDIDEQLLDCLNFLSKKFNLKIKTRKVDVRKEKKLGEDFIGFLTNPVYTEDGVKEFLKYGKNQLGQNGGFGFLEVGDENIGNRFLFLQDFFQKENLLIRELIPNKIYYPYLMLHKEDRIIVKRLLEMFNKEVIEKNPKLGASLYVFEYVPFKIKKIKIKKPIYSYL